jgi:hypothetical protein
MNERKAVYGNVAKEKGISKFLLQDNEFYSSIRVSGDVKVRVVLEFFLVF